VSWEGYDNTFDQWVDEEDMQSGSDLEEFNRKEPEKPRRSARKGKTRK